MPGWLGWSRHAYARPVRFRFGLRIRDVDRAFKLFRRSVFERLPIQSNRRFVHVEILAKANLLGCYMSEVVIACLSNVAETANAEPWRQTLAETMRVFSHPEFGPAPAGAEAKSAPA